MTRFLKQIVSLALCLFFVMAPQSLAISKTNANDTELIYEFMETWDDGDYVANAALNVSDYQTIALDYLTDEFVRSKQGLCVVESIDLTSVRIIKELTDSRYTLDDVSRVDTMIGVKDRRKLETYTNFNYYLMSCNMSVYNENEYFFNGINYFFITCCTENNVRKVFDFTLAHPDAVTRYDTKQPQTIIDEYFVKRFAEQYNEHNECDSCCSESEIATNAIGQATGRTLPSSIRVFIEGGTPNIVTVGFKDYCKSVATVEAGYDDASPNYHKACVLALRNYCMRII